jgi:uncharacterized protein YggE
MDTLTLLQELDAQGVTGWARIRRLEAHKRAWQEAQQQEARLEALEQEAARREAMAAAQRVKIPEPVIQETVNPDSPIAAKIREYIKGISGL